MGYLGVSFSHQAADQETDGDRERSADEAGDKEGMVDYVLADPRRAGAVEVNRGNDCAIGRDEEVAVHRGKHADQQQGPDSERKAERHERTGRRSLAVKQYRRKEETECEGPRRRFRHRAEAPDYRVAIRINKGVLG